MSATPLHHAAPRGTLKPSSVAPTIQVEKEVVDLSGNTRASTPPVVDTQPSPNQEHHSTHEVHSSYQESEDEPSRNRYV
ncbi:hypothetical protein Tco_0483289, partial [Tanacetum coccineum]